MTVNSSSSLSLTTGMTAEAWVNPSALGSAYRAVIFREQPGNEVYSLYADQAGSQFPTGEVFVGGYKDANGNAILPLNSWTHLAETYDGSSVRLYVNGTLVSTTAAAGSLASSSSPLRIGGNSIWGEYFSGLIDEVRVYNRALSAAEIGQDMTTPISPTDTQAPSAPSNLSRNRGSFLGQPLLDCLERQRRGDSLRRLPLDHLGLHALCRQQDRPARGHELQRCLACGRHLLLQGAGRRWRRQHLCKLERGLGRGWRYQPAHFARHPDCNRRGRQGDPLLGGGKRQRRSNEIRRLPGNGLRLHALSGQPDRPAERAFLPRPDHARHLLLPGTSRGRGRERGPGHKRGLGDRAGRHHPAVCALQPGRLC